jgi:hypothetical protein
LSLGAELAFAKRRRGLRRNPDSSSLSSSLSFDENDNRDYRSGGIVMKKITVSVVVLGVLTSYATLNSPALALARYECKGITGDTIVLTPYKDGSVNLSFNKGPVAATTRFSYKGNVFAAEFKNFEEQGGVYLVILDTATKNGYEYVSSQKTAGAAKIVCGWLQN